MIRREIQKLFIAVQFLTLIPLGQQSDNSEESFRQSVFYFTPVGLIVGFIALILCSLLKSILPLPLLAVIVTLVLAIISGFLHLDGLADTMDGFFSSRPKDRKLEIMKDSRIGAMGVIALLFVLIAKITSLASMPISVVPVAALIMPLAGRCALVLSMAMLPYARPEGGLGALFYGTNMKKAAILSILFTGIIIFFCSSYLILILSTIVIVVALFGVWCRRLIGGNTGDTLGALCELTEMSVAIVIASAHLT